MNFGIIEIALVLVTVLIIAALVWLIVKIFKAAGKK
ncbi:hypothetical protein CHEID_01650 [Corynebacterium heidelbergense]|nr:hypothetical protein CHEID_01650 [Corynebacterium heidelbergense]